MRFGTGRKLQFKIVIQSVQTVKWFNITIFELLTGVGAYPLVVLETAASILQLTGELTLQVNNILNVHLQVLHFLHQLDVFLK